MLEICGDGINAGVKECDDGNTINNDGCNSKCNVEYGWKCNHIGTDIDICADKRPIRMYGSIIAANYSLVVRFNKYVSLVEQEFDYRQLNFEIKPSKKSCVMNIKESALAK